MPAWRSDEVTSAGKPVIRFAPRGAVLDLQGRPIRLSLPCGQCIGCRLEKSRQWAMRSVHEMRMYERNCFITLTYNDDWLPYDYGLNVRDWQLFMKRLRKKYGKGIRFLHCGEYGEFRQRPHYHAILFNHDFEDRTLFKVTNGVQVDVSDQLQALWSDEKGRPLGHCTVGNATFESAAYVARYVVKKFSDPTGVGQITHYTRVHPIHGTRSQVKPEYLIDSNGIGAAFFEKYKSDFKFGTAVVRGQEVQMPKFYERLFDPVKLNRIKSARVHAGYERRDDNTSGRHRVRERVTERRLELLPRDLEEYEI